MNCPNCGAQNINGSSFCIKCGANLKELTPMNNMNNVNNANNATVNVQAEQQPLTHETTSTMVQTASQKGSTVSLNFLMYMIAVFLKPIKCFKEEESKLNNSKNSILLALIVTIVMTVANMIKTIFATVRVSSFSFTGGGIKYTWQWSNLKNIKWFELIGKNFLIYACIILAITIVFYVGSLIMKKQLSFIKSLAIVTTSVIPAVVGIMILSPIGALIWSPLSIVFMMLGAVYTIVILYELMNNELKLEGDTKIYFNLVCFGILGVAGYYAYMKLVMTTVSSGLNNLLDMFK